jgi:hypothetical protein
VTRATSFAPRRQVISEALAQKTLPDGRIVAAIPLTFGRARVTIGSNEFTYDDGW